MHPIVFKDYGFFFYCDMNINLVDHEVAHFQRRGKQHLSTFNQHWFTLQNYHDTISRQNLDNVIFFGHLIGLHIAEQSLSSPISENKCKAKEIGQIS